MLGTYFSSPNIELSLACFARPARAATACGSLLKLECTYLRTAPSRRRLLLPSHLRLVRVAGVRRAFWAVAGCGRHESRYGPTLTSSGSTGIGAWAKQNDDDMVGLWDCPPPDLGDSKVVISTPYSRAGIGI